MTRKINNKSTDGTIVTQVNGSSGIVTTVEDTINSGHTNISPSGNAISNAFLGIPDTNFNIESSTLARSTRNRIKDYCDADDFHPTGTWGVSATNDLAALNAAKNAMGVTRTKNLILPDKPMLIPVNGLQFNAFHDLHIEAKGRSNRLKMPYTNATSTAEMISIIFSENVRLTGLTFDFDTIAMPRIQVVGDFTHGSNVITNVTSLIGNNPPTAYILAGMYMKGFQGINAKVTSVTNTTITLDTTFTGTTGAQRPATFSWDGATTHIAALACPGIHLEDITWKNSGRYGASLNSCDDLVVERIEFHKIPERTNNVAILSACDLSMPKNSTYRSIKCFGTGLEIAADHCIIDDLTVEGAACGGAVALEALPLCRNITIKNSHFFNGGAELDDFDVYPEGIENWAENTTIDNVKAENNYGSAITSFGQNAHITNCTIKNSGMGTKDLHGMHIEYFDSTYSGKNTHILNNHVENSGLSGIYVRANGAIVRGNRCVNNGKVIPSAGIHVAFNTSTADSGSYSTINGNICYDDQGTHTQTYGIEVDGNCTNVMMGLDNLCYNNRDAATNGRSDITFGGENAGRGLIYQQTYTFNLGTLTSGQANTYTPTVIGANVGDHVSVSPSSVWTGSGTSATKVFEIYGVATINGATIYVKNVSGTSQSFNNQTVAMRIIRN